MACSHLSSQGNTKKPQQKRAIRRFCLLPAVHPPAGPQCVGRAAASLSPRAPSPPPISPNHTSRHSSTHSTHPKILHISQCPDMTATGASPLLTAAHPAEPSFPVRHSSSPLPPAHTAQPAPLGSNLTVRSHTEGCRQYFPKHHLSLWTLPRQQCFIDTPQSAEWGHNSGTQQISDWCWMRPVTKCCGPHRGICW